MWHPVVEASHIEGRHGKETSLRLRVDFSGSVRVSSSPNPFKMRVPIWVGGESEAALGRVGMIGDGWLPNTLSRPREIERCVSRIRAVAEANRRSMKDLTISCKLLLKGDSKLSATVRMIEKLRASCVTHMIIDFEHGSASQYAEKIKLFSRGVMRSF